MTVTGVTGVTFVPLCHGHLGVTGVTHPLKGCPLSRCHGVMDGKWYSDIRNQGMKQNG
jgi:hypothetical protein